MSKGRSPRTAPPSGLPRLERLLLDEDVDLVEVEPYLRALGFVTKSALLVDPPLVGDVAILKYARRYNWILVCHDKHEPERKRPAGKTGGRPTPSGWFSELAHKGGRVIEIEGGRQQPALEAVGKLIHHREGWLKFFAESHGAVLVHKQGMECKGPERLLKDLGKNLSWSQQIPAKAPGQKPVAHRVRPKKKLLGHDLTPPMILGGGAA